MPSYPVARVGEIPVGSRKVVVVAGRSIGIFNVDGELYALRNRCPHQGGPLCEGFQFSALRSGRPGSYERTRPGQLIRCPWHGWEFDIVTGRSWFDPERTRVRSYPVRVEPLEAETYPVSVEDGCVVVELGR